MKPLFREAAQWSKHPGQEAYVAGYRAACEQIALTFDRLAGVITARYPPPHEPEFANELLARISELLGFAKGVRELIDEGTEPANPKGKPR